MPSGMTEHWTDFERALMAVLERIAEALEAQAPNVTINQEPITPDQMVQALLRPFRDAV